MKSEIKSVVSESPANAPAERPKSGKSEILVINSNMGVEKYRTVQDEFRKTIHQPVREFDLSKGANNIPISDTDLVYCIGSKAYFFAKEKFGEKYIVFSSIINWLRLTPLTEKTYGVSNELHARMPIYMFRSVFPNIRRIGMLYTREYTLQWFENSRKQAKELGIEIIGKPMSGQENLESALKALISESEAIWLISDPLVMPTKDHIYEILEICEANKVPILSYHEAFAKFGAVLIVSVDDPTIGRQAANISMGLLSGELMDEKVQLPAGSSITLNLKRIKDYGLTYNKNALGLVNTIIK